MSATVAHLPARRPRYLAIALTAAQGAVAYRINTVSSIVANFFWIGILYYLWEAAFADTARIGSFTWPQMQTYILLAFGLNALIGFPAISRLTWTIRTGEVAIDLVRPLNYLHVQLARTAGPAVLEAVFSFTIILALGLSLVDGLPPASPLAAALSVVSVAMGFVTKFLFVFTVALLSFWTVNSVGLNWTQIAVVNVLSGTLVPIALMPGWLQPVAEWSPLRGVVATPVGVYLGQYTGWALVGVLALQAGWLVVLWLAADRAWPRAFRAVEIQGG